MNRLRLKLEKIVERAYGDIDCPNCPDTDSLCKTAASYFDRFLEAKAALGDTTELIDASLPLSLLKTFGRSDCLECYLCLKVGAYEFIPVFLWTRAYLYVFERKTEDIKVLSLDQTLFSSDADIQSLEGSAIRHTDVPESFGWQVAARSRKDS